MAKKSTFQRLLSLLPSLALGCLLLISRVDPRVHWLVATLNPLVPCLLLLVFLLMGWQLYRRQYRRAMLSFAIFLLSWSLVQRTFAWGSSSVEAEGREESTFSLATANVYSFRAPRENNYPLDSAAIIAFLDRLSVDVLALQEYDYSASNWRSTLISTYGQLPYIQKISKGSLVIFSRWPLQVVEEKPLGNSVNGYQLVDVRHPAGIFRLVNFHLKSNQITHIAEQLHTATNSSSWQKKDQLWQMFSRYGQASAIRSEQATRIARLVSESPHPLVLAGDMNDVPTAAPYQILLGSERIQDAWLLAGRGIGATFAGNLPGLRIDYILTDTAIEVKTLRVLPEGYGDHRPLKTELRLKKKEST